MDRELWCAVILQAFTDATATVGSTNRHKARAWFRGDGKDFRHVCAMADMDPVRVRREALEAIAQGQDVNKSKPRVSKARSILRQQAEARGLNYQTLIARLHRGWPLDRALSMPAVPGGSIRMHNRIIISRMLNGFHASLTISGGTDKLSSPPGHRRGEPCAPFASLGMVMAVLEVSDIKRHCNITTFEDDGLIADKIDAAEAWIGQFIGKPIDDDEAFPEGTPEPLKEAIRQLVAHLYENREATLVGLSMTDVSPGFYELLDPYRDWVFG